MKGQQGRHRVLVALLVPSLKSLVVAYIIYMYMHVAEVCLFGLDS
jgi:hypothetical protein